MNRTCGSCGIAVTGAYFPISSITPPASAPLSFRPGSRWQNLQYIFYYVVVQSAAVDEDVE
jgi:hypothetical protein